MVKEQWDYVGNFSYGENDIMMDNPKYARYVNPFTEKTKDIMIRTGESYAPVRSD